jgi:hypothetical protein
MASLDRNLNPNISPDSPIPKKIVVVVISDLKPNEISRILDYLTEISRILDYLTLISIILGYDHDDEKNTSTDG